MDYLTGRERKAKVRKLKPDTGLYGELMLLCRRSLVTRSDSDRDDNKIKHGTKEHIYDTAHDDNKIKYGTKGHIYDTALELSSKYFRISIQRRCYWSSICCSKFTWLAGSLPIRSTDSREICFGNAGRQPIWLLEPLEYRTGAVAISVTRSKKKIHSKLHKRSKPTRGHYMKCLRYMHLYKLVIRPWYV